MVKKGERSKSSSKPKKKKEHQDMVLENKVHCFLKENIVHKKGI